MGVRFLIFFCLIMAVVTAIPSDFTQRDKRDVMDTMRNAWDEMVKTVNDAGDAVVNVFKPTEKSALEKLANGMGLKK